MNPENLKPYKPGQSGNPSGKPKGIRNRSTILRELADVVLQGKDLEDRQGQYSAEQIASMAVLRKAMEGDLNAFKEIQDTLYGKVSDKLETSGNLNIQIVKFSDNNPTTEQLDSPPVSE